MARRSGTDPPEPPTPPHTRTDDAASHKWIGEPTLIQLREWATDKVHRLPEPPTTEAVIGSDPSVDFLLVDPTRRVSRRHARLVHMHGCWHIEDLHSRNGIRYDGWRPPLDPDHARVQLMPGMEIGIGGITLIVENETFMRLRGYLARVLGWDATNHEAIDVAMRTIRAVFEKRAPQLELASRDDLVAVARQIHLRVSRSGAPFVVCGKHQHVLDRSLALTGAVRTASAALALAAGGTICVRADELPADHDELRHAMLDPRSSMQLFVCEKTAPASATAQRAAIPIAVPELDQRTRDAIQKIIVDYALDACREFGAAPLIFDERERTCVAEYDGTSFADIEVATRRIVATRALGSVHQAAQRLGLSHVALGKWLQRRGLLK